MIVLTIGQIDRMHRVIKDGEAGQKEIQGIVCLMKVKRYHNQQLRAYLGGYMAACTNVPRLKTLNRLTPYECICKTWTAESERFTLDPIHQMLGLNS